jgi:hypothetical protein
MHTPSAIPKTIKAARALVAAGKSSWHEHWNLGDALVEECGPPGANGVNNGSEKKLRDASNELKRLNLPHTLIWLRKLRSCAAAFPTPDNRLPAISWTVHLEAGNPETLTAAKDQAQQKQESLTVKFVKRFNKQQDHEREEKKRGRKELPDLGKFIEQLTKAYDFPAPALQTKTEALIEMLEDAEEQVDLSGLVKAMRAAVAHIEAHIENFQSKSTRSSAHRRAMNGAATELKEDTEAPDRWIESDK